MPPQNEPASPTTVERPKLPYRCPHGAVRGLHIGKDGRFVCDQCHKLACLSSVEGGIAIYHQANHLLTHAARWPESTEAVLEALDDRDPEGHATAYLLAMSVYATYGQGPRDHALFGQLVAYVYRNVNPELARLHEPVEVDGRCSICPLQLDDSTHVTASEDTATPRHVNAPSSSLTTQETTT